MSFADAADAAQLRNIRPPYVAYKTFEAFLERAAREEVPPRVDSALLNRWQVAAGNESALITTLKSLGLIDGGARPSDDYQELLLSPPRRRLALIRCGRRAYPALEGFPEVVRDPDRLHDYFVATRGLRGQILEKATRFCRHFGDGIGDDTNPRQRVAEPPPRPAVSAGLTSLAVMMPSAEDDRNGVLLTLAVQIPFGTAEADMTAFFRRVWRAWKTARSE